MGPTAASPAVAAYHAGPWVSTESGLIATQDAVINAASNGANVVIAAVTGKKIRVLEYLIIAGAAVNATWESSGGTLKSGALPLAANGGAFVGFSPVGHFDTLQGEGLTLFLSGAFQVSGHVKYVLV